MKRDLKRSFINKKLEESVGDSKKCWKLLSYITNRKKNKANVEPTMMSQEKADKSNQFFATIGTKIQEELGHKPEDSNENPEDPDENLGNFQFSEENPANIEKMINNIRIDVATGEDDIGAKLINIASLL